MAAPRTKVSIVIDDREKLSGIERLLRGHAEIEYRFERLALGDFIINDRVIIERKTQQDFGQSLCSGRLFDQASRLSQQLRPCLLVLEAEDKGMQHINIQRNAVLGALVSLSLKWGIPVIHTRNLRETVLLLVVIAKQVISTTQGGVKRFGYKAKTKSVQQIKTLCTLPGVGRDRAERLLDTFGSVSGVIAADMEALTIVEGIGRKTAENIRNAVCESQASYCCVSQN